MSKTGEMIINTVEAISKKTGYSFKFLMEQYFEIADVERVEGSPLAELEARAFAKQWGAPDEARDKGTRLETEQDIEDAMRLFRGKGGKKDAAGKVFVKVEVDTSEIDKARAHLLAMRDNAEELSREIGRVNKEKTSFADQETTKIRKHNHDTRWAVLAGFAACAVLMSAFGMIIIGILSYARG